jgi:p21-activated kinase 1
VVSRVARDDPRTPLSDFFFHEHCNHTCTVGSFSSVLEIITFHSAHRLGDNLLILMELMDGGSFTNIATFCDCQEPHIAYFAREVLKSLKYMHDRNKIHRDIKRDNVLIRSDGVVKLADFGYTAQLSVSGESRKSIVGTPYWMRPNLIKAKPYSFPVDMWSLGIMCRELAEGEPPFVEFLPIRALSSLCHNSAPQRGSSWNTRS